ncbi:MAG: carboxypeptidase-like regulatory domain-containing protein, partial [Rubricoccaceae bacterium]|nr:carboxypeptidase-like regulatory domain-containing protein [Rubricoccaceae bacterium]
MFRKLSTCVLFLLLGAPLAVSAQGTGTLAGVVTDARTGETLPGVNVIIEGTSLGDATDLDGTYRIIGVPVGEYDVTASYIGYNSQTEVGVEINSGYTREIDFELQDVSIEIDEVTVEYVRPIIQNDAVGAVRVVSGDDIQNLPVRGVSSVAAIQGGVVSDDNSSNLFIRGSREQEVSYYVDGVKVSGPLAVNQAAIQEQEMLIGSIPARYGDAQSGVISITTRTARNDFFGSAELITSEALDAYGYNLGALSIGGPIVPGRVSFFLSGQGTFQADDNPYAIDTPRLSDADFAALQANPQVLAFENGAGDRVYLDFPWEAVAGSEDPVTPDDIVAMLSGQIPEGYSLVSGNTINAPETYTADRFTYERGKDSPNQNYTVNGNMNFNLTDAVSFRAGGSWTRTRGETFSFTRSLYAHDKWYNDETDGYRVYGTLRQRLSPNAFYQIQGEFQNDEFVRYPEGFSSNIEDLLFYGDIDDDANNIARRYYTLLNGEYMRTYASDGGSRPASVGGTFSLPGSVLTNYQQAHNQQYRVSGSATVQQGVHQIEFGGEYEQQTRRFFSVFGSSLARYFDDGNCEQTIEGECVSNYSELSFDAMRAAGVSYYGYDYLGLNEVDDQDIDDWFTAAPGGQRVNSNLAPYKPIYYAGYIQDKIEFNDLVINLGLRVDAFDNNTPVLFDAFAPVPIIRAGDIADRPAGVDPDWAVYFDDANNVVGFRDLDGNFYDTEGIDATENQITQTLSGQVAEDGDAPISEAFTDYETEVTVMPRVGVSFPITGRALFFASYNVTSQRPTERAFAPISSFQELTGQDSRVSNPALVPEKTTQYELGFRQRLGESAALTLSGFYRTQENKISNQLVLGGFPEYGTYLNTDFTTTKGVEVGFDLRRTNNLAVNANYTLSFAQGTGSDATATANIVWRGNYFPDFISPADFDQRHTANISLDYRFGQGEGPMVSGMHLLENFGINILGQFGSGKRYTPLVSADFQVLESFTSNAAGSINSGSLPSTSRIDLKVDRSFDLAGRANAKLYLWVQNILDTENPLAVYRVTGLPDEDGYLLTPGGQQYLAGAIDPAGREFHYTTYVGGPV